MCLSEAVIFLQQDQFLSSWNKLVVLNIFLRTRISRSASVLIKSNLRYTLYFSSVALEIKYTLFNFFLFNKLFNVDVYRVCLILLLLISYLLNVVDFLTKTANLRIGTTALLYKSCCRLRLSAIIKGKIAKVWSCH